MVNYKKYLITGVFIIMVLWLLSSIKCSSGQQGNNFDIQDIKNTIDVNANEYKIRTDCLISKIDSLNNDYKTSKKIYYETFNTNYYEENEQKITDYTDADFDRDSLLELLSRSKYEPFKRDTTATR